MEAFQQVVVPSDCGECKASCPFAVEGCAFERFQSVEEVLSKVRAEFGVEAKCPDDALSAMQTEANNCFKRIHEKVVKHNEMMETAGMVAQILQQTGFKGGQGVVPQPEPKPVVKVSAPPVPVEDERSVVEERQFMEPWMEAAEEAFEAERESNDNLVLLRKPKVKLENFEKVCEKVKAEFSKPEHGGVQGVVAVYHKDMKFLSVKFYYYAKPVDEEE